MRCPKCNTDRTNLSWMREQTVTYWCRRCRASFDVERIAVQSTVRSDEQEPAAPEPREPEPKSD